MFSQPQILWFDLNTRMEVVIKQIMLDKYDYYISSDLVEYVYHKSYSGVLRWMNKYIYYISLYKLMKMCRLAR